MLVIFYFSRSFFSSAATHPADLTATPDKTILRRMETKLQVLELGVRDARAEALGARTEALGARTDALRAYQAARYIGESIPTSTLRHVAYSNLYIQLRANIKVVSNVVAPDQVVKAAQPSDLEVNTFFAPKSAKKKVLRGDAEKILQAYGNDQFRKLAKSGLTPLEQFDTSGRAVFVTGDMPDTVFLADGFALSASVVVTAHEWKKFPEKESQQFSDPEKGQIISYGLQILDAQPWRNSAVVTICNLDIIQFFEVHRGDRITEYAATKFILGPGRKLLLVLLSLSLAHHGFDLVYPVGIPHEQLIPLAGGSTSIVFKWLEQPQDVVVKAFRSDSMEAFETEKKAYELLGEIASQKHLCQLLRSGPNYLLLVNAGGEVSAFTPSVQFAGVVTALEYSHSKGLRHRDVRPANIVERDGVLTLADWSSAVKGDTKFRFVGTLAFASDNVRRQILTGESSLVQYRPEDDLISLVRTIIFLKELHEVGLPRSKDQQLHGTDFWKELQLPNHYHSMMTAASNLDYCALKKLLSP